MGGGSYSSVSRSARSEKLNYMSAPIHDTFKSKSINNAMNPHGIKIRESRDSEEHPNSVPIIIALDVTGSMGSVPHHLVKTGLPHIMETIIDKGIVDPQILFTAIGDHIVDSSPLQVGQFESSDELLDKWLTDVYLESGGGANEGESYHLAWYFAGKHTQHDAMDKRKKKGYLFTIGDEPVLRDISGSALTALMGPGNQYDPSISAAELLTEAKKLYHVYHLHIKQTGSGSRQEVIDGWKQLMADDLIVIQSDEHVSHEIARIVTEMEGKAPMPDGDVEAEKDEPDTDAPTEEIL